MPSTPLRVVAALLVGAAVSCLCAVAQAAEQPLLAVPACRCAVQAAVPLPDSMQREPGFSCKLVELDTPGTDIPAQVISAIKPDGTAAKDRGILVAGIPARKSTAGKRRFQLQVAKPAGAPNCRLEDVDGKSVRFLDGDTPVMVYNYGTVIGEHVPQRDSRRERACYIHPLWGLNGEVLTDDFPRDHYHHHGIFWSWPHVGLEGKNYDMWTSNAVKLKFVDWICRQAGPAAAVLAVENGWFIGEKKVMIERVWMRMFSASGDTRAIDLDFTWIPTDRPITLRGAGGKSYGGLTVRLAVKDASKSIVTTPRGSSKEDLKQTPLPWADLTDRFGAGDGLSGAAVFVHPGHPDYPPTWLTRHYGPLCVGWPGVKEKTFEPGKPLSVAYRVLVHKTQMTPDQLKQAYDEHLATTDLKWQ